MGREVRRVPPNWEHPNRADGDPGPQPMLDENFGAWFAQWLDKFDRIRNGNLTAAEQECYGTCPYPLAAWLRDDGTIPDPVYFRPWRDKDATWFQVWETVTEGTPVSPPFATREELVDYLVEHGDFWRHGRGYSRENAEAFVADGWAPSFVGGPGGVVSGIDAAASAPFAENRKE